MADLLALAFLKKLAESQNNPTLPGPLNALPGPAKQAIGLVPGLGALASPGGQLAQAATGGIMHQDQRAAQAIAGELALLAALAQVKGADAGVPGFDPQSTATASSRAALAQGFAHPGRAMEAIRTGPDTGMAWLGGGLEAASDPTNIIGLPARGATEASKAARVAATIYAAEHAQGLPIEALPRLIQTGTLAEKNAARLRLLREVVGNVAKEDLPVIKGKAQLGPIKPPEQFGYAKGNVPRKDVPLVGGKRQLGPILPPLMDIPAPPPVQPISDLLGGAQRTAQPARVDELLAAVQGLTGRQVTPTLPKRSIAAIEAAIPKVAEPRAGQLGLPPESGVIPADLQRLGLDTDQFDFLDELRGAVQRGKQQEIMAARDHAVNVLEIPADRVARTIEDAYQSLGAEEKAARLAAIEESPYFGAFQFFKKDGNLKAVNPKTGKAIKTRGSRDEVWNIPGSGYDEYADAALAASEGGHNQNYGMSADDYWRNARDTLAEYRALKKPATAAPADLPLGGEIGANLPTAAPEPAGLDFGDRAATIKAVANAPVEHLNNVLRDLHNAVYPGQSADFAIPALTGKARQEFRTSFLTDHPSGNAAEPYLDYLLNRVQKDKKAAARLAEINPLLADDVALVAEHTLPLTEHKRQIQALFKGAPEVVQAAQGAAPAAFTGTIDDVRNLIAGEADRVGTMYAPHDPAYYRKMVNADPAQVPAMLDQLVQEGALGRLPDGSLAVKPAPKPMLGGDIAAGGGGFGLLPFSGGLGAANRAVGGALAGGAVGGIGGALAEPDDRLGGAAKGAGVGALLGGNLAAGAPEIARAAGLGGDLVAHSAAAGGIEQRAANAASTGSPLSALKNIGTVWKQQVTEHWKNILGDELWGRLVLKGAQGVEGGAAYLRALRKDMSSRFAGATAWDREPVQVQDIQRAFGKEGVSPSLGESFHEAEGKLGTVISTSDRMIGGLGLSALNPAGIVTNAAGLLGSTALSGVRPWWHGFFQAFNGFQQATFRRAAYADEGGAMLKAGAESFLPKLQAAGVNVAGLSPDGLFSAKDVHAIAGAKAAQEWQAIASMAEDAATRRVKFLFGDYGKRGGIEKLVGGPIPFTSWMLRAYPVALTMLAQHPAVALGVYHYMQATSAGAGKDGRPGFTAGMVPVDSTTPVLGALVNLYTQGEGGKGYIDPIGGISPVGGDMFQPAEDDTGQSGYQKALGLLNRVGLPGPNPAIQAGAYITGLDYKAPGALSRTQGFENAAALIPGNPQLPNVGALLLRGARGAVSPRAEEAGIPGAKGDKTPSEYDPITRRYADLWIAKTGMALNDPRDPSGLVAMADPDNPLMQQARREVLLGGAVKNAASLTSPVGVIGQSGENKDYRAAKAGLPFTTAKIQATQGSSPELARIMGVRNAEYGAKNPAVNTYGVANKEQAAWALVDDWKAANAWMRLYAPKSYNQNLDNLMIQVGLKEAPKQPAIR